MVNWFKHPQYIPDEGRKLSEAEATYALREAWYRVYGQYPSDRSLAVLWAKSCLETGRWKFIHCYNFGNIKRKPNDTQLFTMFECGEEVSLSQAQKLHAEDPERIKILRIYTSNGLRRASITVYPGHEWSQFRAFTTVEDGAEDYLRFVSQKKRYLKAWQKVIEGDPAGYSRELKAAGYYTGSQTVYTAGVVRLFNEFLKRKEELMSWKPEEKDTDPSPPPISNPEPDEDIHDTNHDIEPPEHEPENDPDTEISNEIPEPQQEELKDGGGMVVVLAFAIGGLGSLIMWLLQTC